MKKPILTIMSILLLLPLIALAGRTAITAIDEKPPAPDFKLKDMDGNEVSLRSLRGKPVIINFWATWCPPCRKEIPAMNRAWHKIKDKGVAMVAIDIGEDEGTVFAFQANYAMDFTILLDESGEEIRKWPVRGVPTTFILDPEGRVVYRATGAREWDDDALLQKILDLRTTASE